MLSRISYPLVRDHCLYGFTEEAGSREKQRRVCAPCKRPEHQLTDGVEDIRSFRRWIEDGSAQQLLNTPLPDVVIDTGNLLVGGDSIGGHIAVTTALLPLTSLPIRVLFLQYPALDMTDVTRTENISEAMQRSTVGAESVPYCEVEDYLANHEKGAVRSRAIFGSRMRLLMGMLQAGKFWDAERDAERLCPMQVLKEGAAKLPPILLYHSQEDEILPRQQTEEWAAKLRRLLPDVPLFLTSQQGDHIFD